ncbi:MAG: methyltransferase [Muribaculaceae bacterium]|nr:methyltransferase [Muribaculaceae bacterium]
MSKKISKFRFKQFAVSHHRSSMKVGVDGVLIGCWSDTEGAKRILDVGTGCGLISLIIAQRNSEAIIDAIDIDESSIDEALENFKASPWKNRLRVELCSYSKASNLIKDSDLGYDLIVSNPPYFDSGVTETVTAREKARHQGELSPFALLKDAKDLLNDDGTVAMVIPSEISDSLEKEAENIGYFLQRKCLVRGHIDAPYKRVLLQFEKRAEGKTEEYPDMEFLTLEISPGVPTEDYRNLCKDFYLKF